MKINKKILIIGHPKCGTGYISKLFQNWGYDIGHEQMGKDGISSWMMTVNAEKYPFPNPLLKYYNFENIICILRHPLKSIQTIHAVSDQNKICKEFREKYIGKIDNNSFNGACKSYLKWNKLAIKKSNLIINVEKINNYNVIEGIKHKLKINIPHNYITPDKNYNSRLLDKNKIQNKKVLEKITDKKLKQELLEFMRDYNYDINT